MSNTEETSTDIVDKATAALDGITAGPWWWGGNIDRSGDIMLCGRKPGAGIVSILKTVSDSPSEERVRKEWNRDSTVRDYFGDFETYLDARTAHPEHPIAFLGDDLLLVPGRDQAVLDVVRAAGLPEDTSRDDPRVHRGDVVAVRNRYAQFIADSPVLVQELLDEVIRLRAELPEREVQR